jgi:mono/diheme cytochrome c family protein
LFLNPFAKIQEVVAQQAKDDSPEVYQKVYQGWKWWHVYCFRCHGIDAFASNLAPNLRESVKVLTYDEFFKTARDGRVEKGMPAWNQLLTDEKIEQVYNYVLARSDEILPPGRPDEVKWSIPKDWPKARAAQKAPEGGATGQAVPGTR